MDCASIERHDMIDRYLQPGRLTEVEAQAFEEHYFGCDKCFRLLEAARLAQPKLCARMAVAPRRSVWPFWLAAAAALVLTIGLGAWLFRDHPQPVEQAKVAVPNKPDFMKLAAYEPPAYEAPVNRGSAAAAANAFQEAMKPYKATDYPTAAERLQQVVAKHPDYGPAHFYLGATFLLLKHPDAAAAEMKRVLDDRESPFREEAQWAIAQAALLQNDPTAARAALNEVVAARGTFTDRARDLLARLAR